MFVLAAMKDTVRVPPWMFDKKLQDAALDILNKKLANMVVPNVGLCVTLWDITKMEDSFVLPGDGASHTIVHFRFVVFRPFQDEILNGKIKSCSPEGVHVSMGFFDDILIPSDSLQHPANFDESEQLWVWQYETEDGKHDLFMDIGEEIRFRVVDEIFTDTNPVGPETASNAPSEVPVEGEPKKAPYVILGTCSEPGLGLLTWWNNT